MEVATNLEIFAVGRLVTATSIFRATGRLEDVNLAYYSLPLLTAGFLHAKGLKN